MKYKLLKDLPKADKWIQVYVYKKWNENHVCHSDMFSQEHEIAIIPDTKFSEWLEPIVEKKTYDYLKEGDNVFWIWPANWKICKWGFLWREPRSELFLTREEAEDEHKRREWAVRPDKFIPKEGEAYYLPWDDGSPSCTGNYLWPCDYLIINLWLAFRTPEECEKAIKEHDLIRLFYTIR